MSAQDRDVVVETTTVAPAPPPSALGPADADGYGEGTAGPAPAPAPTPASAPAPAPAPLMIPQLERLAISDISGAPALVDSPAGMSPVSALAGPEHELARTSSAETPTSRKHTYVPGRERGSGPPSASLLSASLHSARSARAGTNDSTRTLRGRHWVRHDAPAHDPHDGLGKDSMIIQPEDEGGEDASHGTMRMGTSALVSALAALPWESDDETSADEDAGMARTQLIYPQRPRMTRMHSSLHTIRPMEMTPDAAESEDAQHMRTPSLANPGPWPGARKSHAEAEDGASKSKSRSRSRSRSRSTSPHKRHGWRRSLDFPFKENAIARRANPPGPQELAFQFSPSSPRRKSRLLSAFSSGPTTPELGPQTEPESEDRPIRMDSDIEEGERVRKGKLAGRLQEVFGLEEQEEVVEEMACWLLRSSLLKGYMFLTPQRICFFAHLPEHDRKPIKTGPLWKKSRKTKLSTKFWFVLRNDVLSWYESPNDPYFPKGNVSLQYASSCDILDGAKFKLRTAERNYTFTADTEANALEWVRVLRKVIVKTQHEGESVKLIIPLDAVVEIERSPTLEFAETVEVKVVDPEDSMSVDSYFFAGFSDYDYAFSVIQALLSARPRRELQAPDVPSTASLQQQQAQTDEQQAQAQTRPGSAASYASLNRVGSFLRPLIGGERSSVSESRVPIAAPPRPSLPEIGDTSGFASDADSEAGSSVDHGHGGYPPKLVGRPPPRMLEHQSSSWVGTPGWIRKPAAKLFGTSPSSSDVQRPPRPPRRLKKRKQPSVTEVFETTIPVTDDDSEVEPPAARRGTHRRATSGGSSIIHRLTGSTSDWSGVDSETDEASRKFHAIFSLPDTEVLIDDFTGYLYRMVPVHGRFYVSQNYFCFISTRSVITKTKMMIPIKDLYGMKGQKAFRFGHYALVLIVKGYEEIFLEFSSMRTRDECSRLLDQRMEQVARAEAAASESASSLDVTARRSIDTKDGPRFIEEHMVLADKVPSPMFGSSTSSFLDFKPKPMKITCLTIGSRGDVQPYIALCKGLQAEGHECTIATHGEYKVWVEGHGIGFKSVGGDPAQLMQLCVDNGLFTVAFLKEGLAKMRTWLEDLLVSSWKACQGAELLIESPSAMAGIHIAEALQIPYYRAFTMTWTRTRAYPQAFAVPEYKRGGAYNYMTYVMFDQVFWHAISRQVNRWRRKWLHLESTSLTTMEQDKVPFLYNFSPTIVPPPLDWSEWIHVCGYWFLDDTANKAWTPPAGIEAFIDGAHARGQKVVYIGFGSIVVSDPQEMTRCVVEAIVRSGVCAILSKGWSDRGARDAGDKAKIGSATGADGITYPDSVYAIDAIDHAWLFPRIDAAAHHGGAGTTGASLRAGIPTIIKPFFGDQFFWAERVESLGVGDGIKKLTTDALATALLNATTNERQIARARAVGDSIRREDGVGKAIQCLYRDLDYARSIIKPLPHQRSEAFKIARPRAGSSSDTPTEESWSIVSEGSVLQSPSSSQQSSGGAASVSTGSTALGVTGVAGAGAGGTGLGVGVRDGVEVLTDRDRARGSGPLDSLKESLGHKRKSEHAHHHHHHHHRLSDFVDHLLHPTHHHHHGHGDKAEKE